MNNSSIESTWYGGVRDLFNEIDIAHMKHQGVDLSSYAFVKEHAPSIYQRVASFDMPPPKEKRPWTQDMIDTFLKWMNDGCPKGVPPIQPSQRAFNAMIAAKSTATRIRKEITTLTPPEIETLKKAFKGIMAKKPDDLNSYFRQAGYHWLPSPNNYCMHHDPGYNPWHRAYLMSFENALRSIPGCTNVTLPYWDITTPFPDVLKKAPFDSYTMPMDIGGNPPTNKGYKTSRFSYSCITDNLKERKVTLKINRALATTDWEDFHGYFAGAPHNTIISAHDSGHNSIGPTMQNQDIAAFDPIFWFFHCNWDRLFWQWQKSMNATHLNGLLSTIDKKTDLLSYQTFTMPDVVGQLNPFSTNPPKLNSVDIIDSENSLDVDYQLPVSTVALAKVVKKRRFSMASDTFTVDHKLVNVHVKGLNRLKIPGSFDVHLLRDEKVIASTGFFQPNEVEKCENCVQNAVVHFDFELPFEEVSKGKLGIWVEPHNKDFTGDRFPHKLMGNPTVEVQFLISNG